MARRRNTSKAKKAKKAADTPQATIPSGSAGNSQRKASAGTSKPATWRRYLTISRPRFWPYLLGPFLIGAAAAGAPPAGLVPWLITLGVFFTYPANFIIYGINDAYDYDTDKLNPKKRGYEALVGPDQQWLVMRHALTWLILGYLLLELIPGHHDAAAWGLLGFYAFGVLYSMPPVRAKTKPFLDSLFNILYVFPALVSYGVISGGYPRWELFVAAGLWCMAMHAYSAVPDIAADTKAGLRTIATVLGARGTIIFCAACYVAAAYLSYRWLGTFGSLASAVYMAMMGASFARPDRENIFRLYTFFPYLNLAVGMGLFFWVALRG